ncbi:uncharacterized protein LOC132726197 [Ruditapes philippinarum]|uniref:uncharacterized protein LOC132726197 n=1 Tax=Ruditapes philippinarum TaxID=129788 RepID=UPI00295B4C0B|nr:uncharacterized protein LOC132726197 [Ruditapes philippinarum]
MWNIFFYILVNALFTQTSGKSHYGREFIFGIPHNAETTCGDVSITIASSSSGSYNISIPFLNLDKGGPIGKLTEIKINCSIARFGNFIENRGIYLTTSHDVSVYATNYNEGSADSFLVLPVSAIGQYYTVAAYEPLRSENIFIMVVATNSTTQGYINDGNSLHNFTLNQLDVFQFTTVIDIQGMSVTSDKPVTVISGTKCANIPHGVGYCDIITEQMLPLQALDNIYIVPPTPPKEAYELKVTHFNSSVTDSTCFHNISKTVCRHDSSVFIRMGNTPTVVVSKSIISVFQFGFGKLYPKVNIGDPFMTVIQGLQNFLNAYYFAIPSVYINASNHISVIIPKVNMDGLILDESNLTDAQEDIFNVSAPLDNYTVLIMNVSFGFHHIYHINSNVKFGLQVYGLGEINAVGYGYPGGMQLSNFVTMSAASNSPNINSTHAENLQASSTAQSKTPSTFQSLASNQSTISSIINTPVHFHTDTSTINGNTALHNDTNGTETFLQNSSSSTEGDSLGIILGSVFGIIAVLSTVACTLFFLLKRKKMRTSSVQPENEVNDEPPKMLENQDNSEISLSSDTEGLGKGAENVN